MSRFSDQQDESFYISKVAVYDASLALEALENETKHFISHVIDYSLESFNLKEHQRNKVVFYLQSFRYKVIHRPQKEK